MTALPQKLAGKVAKAFFEVLRVTQSDNIGFSDM